MELAIIEGAHCVFHQEACWRPDQGEMSRLSRLRRAACVAQVAWARTTNSNVQRGIDLLALSPILATALCGDMLTLFTALIS